MEAAEPIASIISGAFGLAAILAGVIAYGLQKKYDRKQEVAREKRVVFGAYLAALNQWSIALREGGDTLLQAEIEADRAYSHFSVYAGFDVWKCGLEVYLVLNAVNRDIKNGRPHKDVVDQRLSDKFRKSRVRLLAAMKLDIEDMTSFRRDLAYVERPGFIHRDHPRGVADFSPQIENLNAYLEEVRETIKNNLDGRKGD